LRAVSNADIEAIVVDGHVWLTADEPGLGMHLYEAMERVVPIVGIAKSAYHRGTATPVRRGRGSRPLFVSSAGIDQAEAARLVADMHGAHRVPTMLRLVDRLAREGELSRREDMGSGYGHRSSSS
jgi:deoxyribonuclease V